MRVALFILPPWSVRTAPLGLACLSATLRQAGHEVRSFDLNARLWRRFGHVGTDLWNYDKGPYWQNKEYFEEVIGPVLLAPEFEEVMNDVTAWNPDVAGFSVFENSVRATHLATRILKNRLTETKIVYGGPQITRAHLSTSGEFEQKWIDAAVIGEGEASFIELLERWQNKKSLHGCLGLAHADAAGVHYEGVRPNIDFCANPIPDFSDFDLKLYQQEALPVMMSRGCIAKCTFCAETRYWKNFRSRDAAAIFSEIRSHINRFGLRKFEMNDSLINGNFKVLEELAELILTSGEKITWGGYARLDKRMTPQLLGRLAQSGLNFLNFGLETGSQKIMDLMEKRTTVETASVVVTAAARFGIKVSLNIIVGFPGETETDFQATLEFIRQHKDSIFVVSTGETLMVAPGTPLDTNPARFGIRAQHDGHVWRDEGGHWVSTDGSSTFATRVERLQQLRNFLDEEDIYWLPSGRNKKTDTAAARALQL